MSFTEFIFTPDETALDKTGEQAMPVLDTNVNLSDKHVDKREDLLQHVEDIYLESRTWEEEVDGYPLTEAILQRSKMLIEVMPDTLLDMFQEDCIFGDPNGTMSFEIDSLDGNEVLFSLDVGNTKIAYYAKRKNQPTFFDEFTEPSPLNDTLRDVLSNLKFHSLK